MLYFNLGPKESNKNRNNRKRTNLCQNTKFSIQEIGAPKRKVWKNTNRHKAPDQDGTMLYAWWFMKLRPHKSMRRKTCCNVLRLKILWDFDPEHRIVKLEAPKKQKKKMIYLWTLRPKQSLKLQNQTFMSLNRPKKCTPQTRKICEPSTPRTNIY